MLHSTQTENESSHVVLGMHSTSTSGISRRKGQFCAKGQVPNLQILFAWQLTRPFLKTTQLGCPTSTVRNPRSTRAAVSQQRCHDAQAPYTTPGAAGGSARSTERTLRESHLPGAALLRLTSLPSSCPSPGPPPTRP